LLKTNSKVKDVAASWWDEAWSYRQAINISSHSTTESSVYISTSLTIGHTGKAQTDGGDFRFTDQSGQLLDYYIVSGAGTTTISFHIQFNSFPAGAQTIFAYYGNPSANNGFSTSDFATQASNYTIGSLSAEETGGGPIAYWKFDEGVGTTIYDSSSNNTGYFAASTAAPLWSQTDQCISGKCLLFDGSNDQAYITNKPQTQFGTNDFSISLWIKPTRNLANSDVIFSKSSTLNHYAFVNALFSAYGELRWYFDDSSEMLWSHYVSFGTNASFTNKWTQLTLVRQGTDIRAYVNGILYHSSTLPNSYNLSNNSDFEIGKDGSIGTFYKGYIDEIKIFPYARTATQIKDEYSSSNTKVSIGTNSSGKSLSDGLVGYWKFDEGTGTSSPDFSGNNATATLSGTTLPSWGSGKYGTGVTFDGLTGYVTTGTTYPFGTGSFTVAAWYKSSQSSPFLGIVGAANPGNNTGFALENNNGQLAAWVNGVMSSGSTGINNNQWHHLLFTRNGSSLNFYIDGKLDIATTTSSSSVTTTQTLWIGGWGNTSYLTSGSIDEARIYNRALSSDEVRQLAEYSPPPMAYYKFDEGIGNSISDQSGNNYNGVWAGSGSRWSSGKIGKGGIFNGTDDVISVPGFGNNAPTTEITVSLWMKVDESKTTSAFQLNPDNANNRINFHPCYANGFTYWDFGNIATTGRLNFANPADCRNGWHHYSLVNSVQENFMAVYRDGVKIASKTGAGTFTRTAANLQLGFMTGYQYFKGYMDEVKIYNYARTQKQILEDMQGSVGSFGKPIVHYKFDEGFGTSVANWGSIGSTLNATIATGDSSPSWVEGKISKALTFGGNDYINVPLTSALNFNSFSMSGWFKTSATGVRTGIFKYNTPFGYISLLINTNNTFLFESRDTNNAYLGVSTGSYHDGNWHHFVATRDETKDKMSLFIDGNQVVSVGDTRTGSWNSATSISVGRDTSDFYFNGLIDDFKIYNYALSETDIKTDYNQGANFVFGGNSQTIGGTTTSTEYCVPGDTSPCSPPIAEWKFDEGVGSTAYDSSGNNNNAIFGSGSSAPTWATGKIGKGTAFNGVNTYLSAGTQPSFDISNTLTVETWVKIDPSASYTGGIISKDDVNTRLYNLNYESSGYIRWRIWQGSNSASISLGSPVIPKGIWTHVVGVANNANNSLKLYINGIDIGTTATYDGTIRTSSSVPLTIGSYSTYFFNGSIDQVQIYNYARTPAQIAYDYNRGKPIGWWKMDECQGNTINDWSGNANHGALNIGASGSQNTPGTCQVGTSAAWTAGASGKLNSSAKLDGTDDYAKINLLNLSNSNQITYSLWFKPTNISRTSTRMILELGTDFNSSVNGFMLDYDELQRTFITGHRGGAGYSMWQSTTQVSANTWYHLVGVLDKSLSSNEVKLYINGVLDGNVYSSYNVNTTENFGNLPLFIGSRNGTTYFSDGQIDDVRIYNYPLTSTQIKELYNGGGVNFN